MPGAETLGCDMALFVKNALHGLVLVNRHVFP